MNLPKTWILTVIAIIAGYFLFTKVIFKPSVITVIGEGKVTTTPAKVSFVVARVNTASDPQIAIDSGEAGIITLVNVIKTLAGTDIEIQKITNTVNPTTTAQTTNGNPTTTRAYQVANAFKVTISQPDKTNDIVKELYKNGATSISNISYVPSETDKAEQESRNKAIEDARSKAIKLARSVNKHLGRIISITDDQLSPSSAITTENSTSSNGIDISKRVSIVWEIW